jgi:hypothetical protein
MLECLLMAMWRKKNVGGGAAAAEGGSNLGSEAPPCSCCGGGLDIADPRFNLSLPQPVLEMDDDEYERHVRFATDQIVVTDNIGGFVRALLSVGLDDGRTTTIGVWVSVEREVFKHIVAVGRGELSYDQMQFEGRLASEPSKPTTGYENARIVSPEVHRHHPDRVRDGRGHPGAGVGAGGNPQGTQGTQITQGAQSTQSDQTGHPETSKRRFGRRSQ